MQSVSKCRWRPHKHRPSHGLQPEHSWCTNYLRKIKILETTSQSHDPCLLVCLYFNFLSIFQNICRRCHFRCRAVKSTFVRQLLSIVWHWPSVYPATCEGSPLFKLPFTKSKVYWKGISTRIFDTNMHLSIEQSQFPLFLKTTILL